MTNISIDKNKELDKNEAVSLDSDNDDNDNDNNNNVMHNHDDDDDDEKKYIIIDARGENVKLPRDALKYLRLLSEWDKCIKKPGEKFYIITSPMNMKTLLSLLLLFSLIYFCNLFTL
jgi:hypothetical protein